MGVEPTILLFPKQAAYQQALTLISSVFISRPVAGEMLEDSNPLNHIEVNGTVPRIGFEPMIFWLRTRCPKPLDERAIWISFK